MHVRGQPRHPSRGWPNRGADLIRLEYTVRAINGRDHHPAQRRWATGLEINQMTGSFAQHQCRRIFFFLLVPNIGAEDGLVHYHLRLGFCVRIKIMHPKYFLLSGNP